LRPKVGLIGAPGDGLAPGEGQPNAGRGKAEAGETRSRRVPSTVSVGALYKTPRRRQAHPGRRRDGPLLPARSRPDAGLDPRTMGRSRRVSARSWQRYPAAGAVT
jgi:hypothetical protein